MAATRSCTVADAGAALIWTTGEAGSPLAKADQQPEVATAQLAICRVEKTPASVATYTVLASCGSTTRLLTGAKGRLAVNSVQCAPPSVVRLIQL